MSFSNIMDSNSYSGGVATDPDSAELISARERVLGPAYRAVTLAPGGALHLEQTFLAGQRAQIVAAAIGPGAIELTVDEGEGRRSCPTQNRRARCDWIPTATTRISIDLYNRAAAADRFVIILR